MSLSATVYHKLLHIATIVLQKIIKIMLQTN